MEADDFFSSGLHLPGNTSNPMGAAFKAVTVNQMPGLNTLGIVIARLDFERKGFLPPHFHARATEILTVLKGSMEVGFVTSNPSFRHFKKVLQKGGVRRPRRPRSLSAKCRRRKDCRHCGAQQPESGDNGATKRRFRGESRHRQRFSCKGVCVG